MFGFYALLAVLLVLEVLLHLRPAPVMAFVLAISWLSMLGLVWSKGFPSAYGFKEWITADNYTIREYYLIYDKSFGYYAFFLLALGLSLLDLITGVSLATAGGMPEEEEEGE